MKVQELSWLALSLTLYVTFVCPILKLCGEVKSDVRVKSASGSALSELSLCTGVDQDTTACGNRYDVFLTTRFVSNGHLIVGGVTSEMK